MLLRVEKALLEDGIPARSLGLSPDEQFVIKSLGLLTLKPVIYAFNIDEVDYALNREETINLAKTCTKQIQYCDTERDSYIIVSAKLEAEMESLSIEERAEYLESIGIDSDDSENLLSYNTLPLLVKDVLDLGLVYTGPGVQKERSH